MSFFTQAYLLDKYGPRLDVQQAAEALGFSEQSLRNRLSRKSINLRTYLDGGARFVDVRDLAEYLDQAREGVRA